jgi:hypothetical protein
MTDLNSKYDRALYAIKLPMYFLYFWASEQF